MNKDQVTIIATVAVVVGSTAIFAAARMKARKAAKTDESIKTPKILKNHPSN